ncbi:hypothetical protein [Sinorhizobium fredii]|nr:hypothetical protein [Sinorhizobium fredii]
MASRGSSIWCGRARAVVLVGLPVDVVRFELPGVITRKVRIETVFR